MHRNTREAFDELTTEIRDRLADITDRAAVVRDERNALTVRLASGPEDARAIAAAKREVTARARDVVRDYDDARRASLHTTLGNLLTLDREMPEA